MRHLAPSERHSGTPSRSARQLKILIVTDWFLKLVVEGQAAAFRVLGHEVRLLCRSHAGEFNDSHAERRVILEHLRTLGIEITELPGRRFGPEGLHEMIQARKQIRQWRPDVVFAHENTDPRLLIASRGAPIIYTIHDPEPHPGERRRNLRERMAARLWIEAADCIVVHGSNLVDDLPRRAARKRVGVVPHGIDVGLEPLLVPPDPLILLFGRMEAYKGVGILVEAMDYVWRERPDVRLLVAGRGPATDDVPSDHRIEVIPQYVSEAELRRLLARATVSALPYTQASQSGVGLLSIAHGVPIVVTRVGALPELVRDPRCIAEAGDPKSLGNALLHALETTDAGRDEVISHARAEFSWLSVAERYLALYRTAVPPDVPTYGLSETAP